MSKPPYAPHDRMTAPARPRAELWRTAAGLLLGVVLFFALSQGFISLVLTFAPGAAQPGTALHALVSLLSVGLIGMSAAIVCQTLHMRPAHSMLGDIRVARADFRRALPPMAGLTAVLLAVQMLATEAAPIPAQGLGAWLLLLPLGLGAILVQAAAEEVVFRGYLQQQLAARLASPALWLGLPSALFAALHFSPAAYGGNAALIALWAGVFGLALGDLTARTGSLGAAIAVHFTMNAFSILGIALPGPLAGLALYVLPFGTAEEALLRALLPGEFLSLLLVWLTARLALRV